ncbi:hypothetical protein FJZ39_03235 [Candidatus Saccharibacteria bacterium]|nr:hypothetical protein [Candidatus Saccharibacteria bacterium]
MQKQITSKITNKIIFIILAVIFIITLLNSFMISGLMKDYTALSDRTMSIGTDHDNRLKSLENQ